MRFLVHQSDGLGNQLFQYAAGRFYARQYAAEVEVLIQPAHQAQSGGLPRPFMLSRFQIKAPARVRNKTDDLISNGKRRYRLPLTPLRAVTRVYAAHEPFAGRYTFKPTLPVPRYTRRVHLVGYWQVHQIADALGQELRGEYAFREPPTGENARVLAAIRQCAEPVSVHLRRGDYQSFQGADVRLPLSYYVHALEHVRQRVADPTFVVFSDEPELAKANLPALDKAIFVRHNDALSAHEDLRLMSCCKHHIIANSSFSWWGAWLNADERKLVCAPAAWLGGDVPSPDILPPRWARIGVAA